MCKKSSSSVRVSCPCLKGEELIGLLPERLPEGAEKLLLLKAGLFGSRAEGGLNGGQRHRSPFGLCWLHREDAYAVVTRIFPVPRLEVHI